MKIAGKKDLGACRAEARAAIDAVMLPRITATMGPKFALYQLKANVANGGLGGQLISTGDDVKDAITRFEIVAKFNALVASIAILENERQAIQARIDAATTASEIDAILASL